ncbi:MAG: L-glyceraldehyde 3-phosphate reductase [Bacteroidota bacterium]
MTYSPNINRYNKMQYRRCGTSGLLLPAISLGLWHNFGFVDDFENSKQILFTAFDNGITHFDLANNYGPPAGSAEENFGKILKENFTGHLRDELVISTKAGYTMWPGPYGDWGSRKYLINSLDQSLKRMQLECVDIFYHHRPDPATPLEETVQALNSIVKSGKALYIGLSNYKATEASKAISMLASMCTPCIIHQPKYSMFERWVEEELLNVLGENNVGCIPFSPLAQGLLTDKYLKGIPENSRASKEHGFLKPSHLIDEKLDKVRRLNELAKKRNQSLAQMALAWILKDERVTSVLIGVSKPQQVIDSIACLQNPGFNEDELNVIEAILG